MYATGTQVWYEGRQHEVVECNDSYMLLAIEVPPPMGTLVIGVRREDWDSITTTKTGG